MFFEHHKGLLNPSWHDDFIKTITDLYHLKRVTVNIRIKEVILNKNIESQENKPIIVSR